jgi:hypothetical protein
MRFSFFVIDFLFKGFFVQKLSSRAFFEYNLAFFFLEKELSTILTNKMRSDVLKPIFPTKHRNLNAKSKESSGIEHLAVENSKYQ